MSYFEKANELYYRKDYENAILLYKKSAQNKEYKASSLYNAAVCFIKLKEYKKSIPLLKSALALKEESKYYFNLGYSYSMLGDSKRALICFNTAWALDPSDEDCKKAINLILEKYKK